MWSLSMEPIVQSSTTSHHQDVDKCSHFIYGRKLHGSPPHMQVFFTYPMDRYLLTLTFKQL
jgi:hypothetical protein